MKYEDLLNRCVELRLERERADARLLLFIYEIETKHMQVLAEAGNATISEFIRSNKLVDTTRYSLFVAGLGKLGGDVAVAETLGAEATIAAAKLTNGDATRDKYIEAITAWRLSHHDVSPSREQAVRLRNQVDPRPELPAAVKQAQLIAALKQRISELEVERAELRAELKRWRGWIEAEKSDHIPVAGVGLDLGVESDE